MSKQPPKLKVEHLTIRLPEPVVDKLEKLLHSHLFGFDVEEVAGRLVCRWLWDNRDHPYLQGAPEDDE